MHQSFSKKKEKKRKKERKGKPTLQGKTSQTVSDRMLIFWAPVLFFPVTVYELPPFSTFLEFPAKPDSQYHYYYSPDLLTSCYAKGMNVYQNPHNEPMLLGLSILPVKTRKLRFREGKALAGCRTAELGLELQSVSLQAQQSLPRSTIIISANNNGVVTR
jgi:hypothetical protein